MQQTTYGTTDTRSWSVPRRQLDLEDYIQIVRRNIGWLFGPLLAALSVSVVVAFLWPDTYVSTAAIRVVPPQVPERFVPTNVNVQMAERVQSMAQTVLSRNTLTNIIQTYDLYRKDRNRLPMEDIIENMRKDIEIGGFRPLSDRERNAAFQIQFSYENRYVAQKVTRDLMTRFIDENIRERSMQSQMTTQFLREQWEEARRELDTIEQKLTQFRVANLGRLPEQMDSNMQQMTALDSKISALNASVSRANQDKLVLEGDLRGLRDKMAALRKPFEVRTAAGRPAMVADPVLDRMDAEITGLQRGLEQMLEVYKPTYPDVQRLQARLKAAQKEREAYIQRKLRAPAADTEPSEPEQQVLALTPTQQRDLIEVESQATKLQGMLRARELEIDRYMGEISEAERKIKEVYQRIEVGPINLQAYEQLRRDYNLAKARYDDLNAKVTQSTLATDLENRKQGETLEVLDLPSLPETPTEPNRPIIIGIGSGIGLIAGVLLIALRDLKDTSLKSLKDVRTYTQFPVLGSIPLLENDLVIRRRRRIAWIAWSTGVIVSIVIMAFPIYYYYNTRL
jgi:polysaccharide chain length determinant protein (PEP-CTERM system associated)